QPKAELRIGDGAGGDASLELPDLLLDTGQGAIAVVDGPLDVGAGGDDEDDGPVDSLLEYVARVVLLGVGDRDEQALRCVADRHRMNAAGDTLRQRAERLGLRNVNAQVDERQTLLLGEDAREVA